MDSETTGIIGSNPKPLGKTFNIEILRFGGLLMSILMLCVGKFTTDIWPSVWGKGSNPASVEETYIWKLFGFAHTCVFIDFNPSKTIAALLLNTCTLPLMMFTYFNHLRITVAYKKREVTQLLFNFSKYTWIFRFISFMLFFMVFVNSPDEEYGTTLGWEHYLLHYIPFMLWQLAQALMAVEQTCFNYQMNNIAHGIPKHFLRFYIIAISVFFVYYTVYIWCHIFEVKSLPGYDNIPWSKFIMYTFIILSTLIPVYFGYCEYKGLNGARSIKNTFEFY